MHLLEGLLHHGAAFDSLRPLSDLLVEVRRVVLSPELMISRHRELIPIRHMIQHRRSLSLLNLQISIYAAQARLQLRSLL